MHIVYFEHVKQRKKPSSETNEKRKEKIKTSHIHIPNIVRNKYANKEWEYSADFFLVSECECKCKSVHCAVYIVNENIIMMMMNMKSL